MAKILILDDDAQLVETVSTGLTAQGYTVERSGDGSEALYRMEFYHFDLAILDWSVPGLSGVQVCREYRAKGGQIPIIMLTGKNDISNKEEAFDFGADDYLTKPFSFRELAARVKALLRRPQVPQGKELAVGAALMNTNDRTLHVSGKLLAIAPAEFAMLELFFKAPNHTFTSAELLNKLYSSESETTDEAVRQRVFRLRKALNGKGIGIKTASGGGYRLEVGEV